MSHDKGAFGQIHSKSDEQWSEYDTNKMNSSNYTNTAYSFVTAAVNPTTSHGPFEPNRLDDSGKTRTGYENSGKNVPDLSNIKLKGYDENRTDMHEVWHCSQDLLTSKCQSSPRAFPQSVSTHSVGGFQNSDSLNYFKSSHQLNQQVSEISLLQHARSSSEPNFSERDQASSYISESINALKPNQLSTVTVLNYHKNFNSNVEGSLQESSCCESIIIRRSKENPTQLMARNDISPSCEIEQNDSLPDLNRSISAKLIIGTDGRHRVYALCNGPASSCWRREAILHINEAIIIAKTDIQFKDKYRRFYTHITSKGTEKKLYKKWCLVCDKINRTNASRSQQSINNIFVTRDFQCLWSAVLSIEILSLLGHNKECLRVCETELLGSTSFSSKAN